MASRTPVQTPAATNPTAIPPDAYRAYADYLVGGGTDDLTAWYTNAGKAAIQAMQDQRDAEMRTVRQSAARAVARDFKVNGKLTTYSRDRAVMLLAFLQTVDFDTLPDPATDATDDDATDGDATS